MQSSSSSAIVSWQPGSSIPFADYEDEREGTAGGQTDDGVQLIWWGVAASYSREASRITAFNRRCAQGWGMFRLQPLRRVIR